ncbi:MAG: hypothetical protein LBQ73_09340 [Tannerellaceae bacterium]|nr:hypothetical protein [Tannerellaceae bacterium]
MRWGCVGDVSTSLRYAFIAGIPEWSLDMTAALGKGEGGGVAGAKPPRPPRQ